MDQPEIIRNAAALLAGLLLIACGFWGSMLRRPFYAAVLAWCAPIGLLLSLVALVLLCIPDFFTG
ncbi:MAG: hypothetical protein OEU26_10315 [Candidatus Tectomicrobia bacterium]|nr:hypothetical protein [Candidatus Tectomicrobia bacterium]